MLDTLIRVLRLLAAAARTGIVIAGVQSAAIETPWHKGMTFVIALTGVTLYVWFEHH